MSGSRHLLWRVCDGSSRDNQITEGKPEHPVDLSARHRRLATGQPQFDHSGAVPLLGVFLICKVKKNQQNKPNRLLNQDHSA